jgi:hypothetical protein
VAYRETVTREVPFTYTHKKQTGGSGQYAKLGGVMRPMPEDSEEKIYRFVDNVVGGKIPREFISSCDNGFRQALDRGVLIGFPVVGVEMEVNDGAAHAVDSSDMAFQIAARAAFKETMPKAAPVILEPIMKVGVETPEEFQGPIQGGLVRRRGNIVGSESGMGTVGHRGPRAAGGDVRLLDRAALELAGQGRVHDGVRQVRARPAQHPGRADQEVRRQPQGLIGRRCSERPLPQGAAFLFSGHPRSLR